MPSTRRCTILAVRHGQSKANVANLVVSTPQNGCNDYGLTELGHAQAKQTAFDIRKWLEDRSIDLAQCGLEIWCSDFLRTRETAADLASVLGCQVHATELLRERDFGLFELQSAESTYSQVWAHDKADPDHTFQHAESVRSVRDRAMRLVTDLAATAASSDRDMVYVLVAHGDILQILQTQFVKDVRMQDHRDLEHIEPGGWRVFSVQ